MAGVDLSTPFVQLPEQEKAAPDQARAASQRNQEKQRHVADAIAFAAAAIQQAESAAITAMHRRTRPTQINRSSSQRTSLPP